MPSPKRGTPAKPQAPPPKSPGWETREGKLRIAAILLWVSAAIQILAGIVFVAMVPHDVDRFLTEELAKKRMTLFQVQSASEKERAAFDQMRAQSIATLRLWQASDVVTGVVTAACAFMVRRKPVLAASVPFLIFLPVTASKIAYQGIPTPVIFGRILLLYILLAAMVAAIAAVKQKDKAPTPV